MVAPPVPRLRPTRRVAAEARPQRPESRHSGGRRWWRDNDSCRRPATSSSAGRHRRRRLLRPPAARHEGLRRPRQPRIPRPRRLRRAVWVGPGPGPRPLGGRPPLSPGTRKRNRLDEAVARFAVSYADQTERDHAPCSSTRCGSGRIEAPHRRCERRGARSRAWLRGGDEGVDRRPGRRRRGPSRRRPRSRPPGPRLVAPAMTEATGGAASIQAMASSTTVSALVLGERGPGAPPRRACRRPAARLRSAGTPDQASARRRRLAAPVLAGEHARGQREVGEEGQPGPLALGRGRRARASRCSRLYWFCTLTKRAAPSAPPPRPPAAARPRSSSSRSRAPCPARTSSSRAPRVSAIGRLGVGGVQLVEVDVVGPQAPQAVLEGLADVGGLGAFVLGVDLHAELGGEHDLVAARAQGAAQELLALGAAVDVGGVEEGDAGVEGGVHHRGGARRRRCGPPKLLQPRPTTDTSSEPILRVSHHRPLRLGVRSLESAAPDITARVAGPGPHADGLAGGGEQGAVLGPQVGQAVAEAVGQGVHVDVAQDPVGGDQADATRRVLSRLRPMVRTPRGCDTPPDT